ncbi:MAG: hypothetical protein ACPGLV_07485 [Bacteroidia bacterium]
MRQFLIAAFAIFISVSAFAQDSKVTGFRDLVWGVHKDSVYSNGVKMKFKKDKDAAQPNSFTSPGDNMNLGAAKLTKIVYTFNAEDRFKKVMMYGDDQYLKDIKDILAYKFQKADNVKEPSSSLKVSSWGIGDVSVALTQNKIDANWVLSIESNWEKSRQYITNLKVNDIVYKDNKVLGFRDLKWLDSKDSIYVNGEKLTFLKDNDANQLNSFYLENDKSTFGSIRLTGINYVFNENDKLNGIVLNGNMSSYEDMKFILNHKFGAAEDVNVFGVDMSVTNWKIADTSIKLTESGSGDSFSVIIENTKDQTQRIIKNKGVTDF